MLDRRAFLLAAITALGPIGPGEATALPLYLRLGTGPAGEGHFSLGAQIGRRLSNPPGTRCVALESCGVPGLVVAAIATDGPFANVEALAGGRIDMALIDADLALLAQKGEGLFKSRGFPGLRAVAQLPPDRMHLVASRESDIASPAGLRRRRVGIGADGSATQILARALLRTWGLGETETRMARLRPDAAADAFLAGEIDALFILDGTPSASVAELAERRPLTLVPLDGPRLRPLLAGNPLLRQGAIPAGLYPGIGGPIPTIEVELCLTATERLAPGLVSEICRALWRSGGTAPGTDAAVMPPPAALPPHPGTLRFLAEASSAH